MAAYAKTIARTSKRLRISEMHFTVVYRLAVTTILRFTSHRRLQSHDSTAETVLDWRILKQM